VNTSFKYFPMVWQKKVAKTIAIFFKTHATKKS